MSLEIENGEYWWSTVSTKRLRFEQTLQRGITSSVWPTIRSVMPPDAPPATWRVRIDAASRPFEIKAAVREHQADRVGLSLQFSPDPQPGDFIEFSREVRSKYLNPTFQSDLPAGALPPVTIAGRQYCVVDGMLTVERTERLHLYFSFPRNYNLRPEDVAPFVASHTSYIDYPAPWELDRLTVEIESFGSQLIADLRVENPVPRHLYGLAWNPPVEPASSDAGETDDRDAHRLYDPASE